MTHQPTRSLRRWPGRVLAGAVTLSLAAAGLVATTAPAQAAPPTPTPRSTPAPQQAPAATAGAPAPREFDEAARNPKTVDLSRAQQKRFARTAPKVSAKRSARAASTPTATGTPIGGTKPWLVLDDYQGSYAAANYVLRGVGSNIEVWVQQDLDFPEGDCRNDGVRNVVTDAQVQQMIHEFDTNILPKESKAFSVAPARNGTNQQDVGFGAPMWQLLGGGDPDFYKGDGNKTVVLVSNVRDANYYDPTSPAGSTYIAGFFYSLFNEAFDRNIMTIDSYDWLHRTGANPPDEEPGGLCSPQQAAQPHLYEGTFAHEYQHLLEYYQDPDEETWLNEGMSDYAQSLVGYVDTSLPYGATGADSHITCYQGFLGSDSFPYCGAENSVTRWSDQGGNEILADYGASYAYLTYLADQFGQRIITALHRAKPNGLASVQAWLDDHAPGLTAADTLHDFTAQMALDRLIDHKARGLTRDQRDRFTAKHLSSAIDWSWTGSYDSPGAPTNGADYVLAAGRRPFNGRTVKALNFRGDRTYAPDPLLWKQESDGSLWSGEGDELDSAAVVSVDVPKTDATLTFDQKTEIETGWDFGVVQVSTDGGKTYTTLSNDDTTAQHESAAAPNIVQQLPGFTGTTDWASESFDLSAYSGETVLLSLRYLTDAASNGNGAEPTGWWVKNVQVGDTAVDLSTARSATQVSPTPVAGWSVQVIGWSLNGKRVAYLNVHLNRNERGHVGKGKMRRVFRKADRIAVIVMADDPTETATKYAGYRLKIGRTVQPGGGGSTTAATVPVSLTDASRR